MTIPNQFILCLGLSAETIPFAVKSIAAGFNLVTVGLHLDEVRPQLYTELAAQYPALASDVKLITLNVAALDGITKAQLPALLASQEPFQPPKSQASLAPTNQVTANHTNTTKATPSLDNAAPVLTAADATTRYLVLIDVDIRQYELLKHIGELFAIKAIIPSPVGRIIKVQGRLNDELHLPGITEQMALNFTDKLKVHQCFASYNSQGELTPCHDIPYVFISEARLKRLAESGQALSDKDAPTNACSSELTELCQDIVIQLSLPVIVKPRFGSGSKGISVAFTQDELAQALIKGYQEFKPAPPDTADILVERFISGQEYSCYGLIMQGQIYKPTIIKKSLLTPLPYRQELAYAAVNLEPELHQAILHEVTQCVRALGLNNCLLVADVLVAQPPHNPALRDHIPTSDMSAPISTSDMNAHTPTSSMSAHIITSTPGMTSSTNAQSSTNEVYYDRPEGKVVYVLDIAGRHCGYRLVDFLRLMHIDYLNLWFQQFLATPSEQTAHGSISPLSNHAVPAQRVTS